jgi:hypothetical protein
LPEIDAGMKIAFLQRKQIKKLHLGISAEIDPGMKKRHLYFSSAEADKITTFGNFG